MKAMKMKNKKKKKNQKSKYFKFLLKIYRFNMYKIITERIIYISQAPINI